MTTGAQTLTEPGGPLAPTAPPERDPEALSDPVGTVYLIQREAVTQDGAAPGNRAWVDMGTVTVPKRSSLKTVFDAALEELQELRPTQSSGPMRLRAVQPENVAEWEALLEVPPAPEPQIVVRPVG